MNCFKFEILAAAYFDDRPPRSKIEEVLYCTSAGTVPLVPRLVADFALPALPTILESSNNEQRFHVVVYRTSYARTVRYFEI